VQPPLSPHFYLWQIDLNGQWNTGLNGHPFLLVTIINGSGTIECENKSFNLSIGTNMIIPNNIKEFKFLGNMKMVISTPGNQD